MKLDFSMIPEEKRPKKEEYEPKELSLYDRLANIANDMIKDNQDPKFRSLLGEEYCDEQIKIWQSELKNIEVLKDSGE